MKTNDTFSAAQLELLKAEFGKLQDRVNPESILPKLNAILDAMNDKALLQVAKSKIKFMSGIAVNRCVERGIWG